MAITIQSTYATGFAAGYAGMVANGEESNRISRTVEDSAGIAFGKAAFRGSGDHGVTATPAAGTFMGVTIADQGIVADQAYVTPAGVWTNTSNSSANPQVPAKFDETVSSGGVCRLRVTRS
jgi:hypothetical protein